MSLSVFARNHPNGTLCNFVESITNSQWEIAVEKVMRSCEQTPKLILTVKVLEVDDKHTLSRLSRPNCTGSPKDISKGTSGASSHKKGGKPKRKATELQEDTLLWAKLRAGTPITRNKRQEERLYPRQRQQPAF